MGASSMIDLDPCPDRTSAPGTLKLKLQGTVKNPAPCLLTGGKPAYKDGHPEDSMLEMLWAAFDHAHPEVRQ